MPGDVPGFVAFPVPDPDPEPGGDPGPGKGMRVVGITEPAVAVRVMMSVIVETAGRARVEAPPVRRSIDVGRCILIVVSCVCVFCVKCSVVSYARNCFFNFQN